MSTEEMSPTDEGVAAVLGMVLLHFGGEVRVPMETVESGLPANSGVGVTVEGNDMVVRIEKTPEV